MLSRWPNPSKVLITFLVIFLTPFSGDKGWAVNVTMGEGERLLDGVDLIDAVEGVRRRREGCKD